MHTFIYTLKIHTYSLYSYTNILYIYIDVGKNNTQQFPHYLKHKTKFYQF